MTGGSNQAQAEFWNADPGRNWVRFQPEMDILLRSVSDLVLTRAAPKTGERVIDIGCGAGATTLAVAKQVGPTGQVSGIDISEPLLTRAEERRRDEGLDNAGFLMADAQTHPFLPGAADLVVSRFGVMFFADPVAAFRNIAVALRPGGRMVMAAWAAPEDNPFFAIPARITAGRLGPSTPSDPTAPGPMAFRDLTRVVGILEAAGLSHATGEAVPLSLHHPGGVEAVLTIQSHIGGLPRLLRDIGGTEQDFAAILGGMREAYAGFASPDGIRIPALINLFSAIKG